MLAETLLQRGGSGDRDEAVVLLRTCLETAERKGLVPLASRITALLRVAVPPTGPATPAYPDGLSAREVEVLRLLAKVKVGNRTEAAAYALRRGLA